MSLAELQKDLSELQLLVSQATRTRVQTSLNFEIRKVEADILKVKAITPETQDATSPTQQEPKKIAPARNYEVKLQNYAWDQSDNFVKILVSLNGVQDLPEDKIAVTSDERWMELRVEGLEGKNYVLRINNLLQAVGECSCKCKKDTVVVSMKKKRPGAKWSHVTETDKRAADSKAPKKRQEEEEGPAEDKDPSAGLMDMMKQMYEDGDDDMKRMIAKAWTEGKGKQSPDFPVL